MGGRRRRRFSATSVSSVCSALSFKATEVASEQPQRGYLKARFVSFQAK